MNSVVVVDVDEECRTACPQGSCNNLRNWSTPLCHPLAARGLRPFTVRLFEARLFAGHGLRRFAGPSAAAAGAGAGAGAASSGRGYLRLRPGRPGPAPGGRPGPGLTRRRLLRSRRCTASSRAMSSASALPRPHAGEGREGGRRGGRAEGRVGVGRGGDAHKRRRKIHVSRRDGLRARTGEGDST